MTQPPIVPGQPQYPAYAQPFPLPVVPPKKGLGTGAILALILGPILVMGLVCGGLFVIGSLANSSDRTPDTEPSANSEAKVTSCTIRSGGQFVAEVSVTNTGSKRRYYTVNVVFQDGKGGRIDSGSVYLGGANPGDVLTGEVTGRAPGGQSLSRCGVTSVTRA